MKNPTFRAPPSVDQLPAAELDIQAFWEEHGVFAKSVSKPAPNGSYVFFEGPPTANNVPHVGHALTRAIKDVLPRFKTMQGYRVERKAGWDTHGLPVEISIEKELGFKDKGAIEEYGVEAFNQKCFDSVRRYEREWVKASERLGYWLDYDEAYFTFTNQYVESVWWILGQMFEQGMLYEGHKVLPYCPLCGTTHSSHEVAQGYRDVKDPSITVGLNVLDGQSRGGVDFGDNTQILVWTTTPWTLPSNMAACAHPDHDYVLVQAPVGDRRFLLARDMQNPVETLVDNKPVDLRNQPVLATFKGAELAGLQYEPLFPFAGTGTAADDERGNNWSVVVDSYVTLESGSGIVHVAPAFGDDDHRVGNDNGLSMYCALQANGRFKDHTGDYAGLWFKDADVEIIGDLKRAGQLVRSEKYEHSYPFCWRHGTPLYYFATSSWFVRTTAMQADLLANNQKINWEPAHIQDGRFGRWLEGVVDWALSRKRYWGTPLPIWRCTDCNATHCVSSYAELFERAGRPLPTDPYDRDQFNPHRPYVDDMPLPCTACDSGTMNRVVEVIDCWFDAGSMPFAQHHYPFNKEMAERIDSGDSFPADFISEAVDQTRGWFYTLHVISTFLKQSPAYKNCIVLGHVLDEQGRKMSKSIGNVVAPDDIINQFGADSFRWFFYRSNPTQPSRFGASMVRDSLKGFFLPLLNSWSFFSIYADIDGFDPASSQAPAFDDRAPLDRWVLSELQGTVTAVTEAVEGMRLGDAARAIEGFVEGLTNWYIRRSRRRFWKSESDADKRAAYWTLYEVLTTLSRLLAPFTPFLAERMHQDLVRPFDPAAAESVHLATWPTADASRVDAVTVGRMAVARQVVSLGHAARQGASAGVRQPLASATIVTVSDELAAALEDASTAEIVRDELNVRALQFATNRAAYVTYQVKPNFKVLGRVLGKRMGVLAKAMGGLDAGEVVAAWERDAAYSVPMPDGDPVELSGDMLDVRIQQREGTASAYDDVVLVALDTQLDEDLLREGLAREVINRIQGLRKDNDLAYDDRIHVRWDCGDGTAEAFDAHGELIAAEVLAASMERSPGLDGGQSSDVRGDSLALSIEVARP